MIKQNYRDLNLYNGDTGVLVELNGSFKFSVFRGQGFELIPIHLLPDYETAYAMTIHKSQGSQWPNCFVILPIEAEKMIDQTLLYTASTRPSERLVLMGDERIIEKAIQVGSKALNRATFLREKVNLAFKLI